MPTSSRRPARCEAAERWPDDAIGAVGVLCFVVQRAAGHRRALLPAPQEEADDQADNHHLYEQGEHPTEAAEAEAEQHAEQAGEQEAAEQRAAKAAEQARASRRRGVTHGVPLLRAIGHGVLHRRRGLRRHLR